MSRSFWSVTRYERTWNVKSVPVTVYYCLYYFHFNCLRYFLPMFHDIYIYCLSILYETSKPSRENPSRQTHFWTSHLSSIDPFPLLISYSQDPFCLVYVSWVPSSLTPNKIAQLLSTTPTSWFLFLLSSCFSYTIFLNLKLRKKTLRIYRKNGKDERSMSLRWRTNGGVLIMII